jgi:signal transduction histidine kinase
MAQQVRILVVEDERIVALNLQQQLRRLGYSVPAPVASGEQALAKIRDLKPDLVLMDINIEGTLDGIETASCIPAELGIPVVYLTAYADEPTLVRARSTRPYGYLVKPYSERELHATIQVVLERCRTEAALREHGQLLDRLVQERTAELSGALARLERETVERVAAEKSLRQVQKMEAIGQLTGGIAHDFNNLLTVVLGALELIRSDPRNVARIARLSQTSITMVERGMNLIRHLLMFSRRQAMYPEQIDPNEIVADFRPIIEKAVGTGTELVIRLQPSLARVLVDPTEFQTALLNVIINAREAITAPGGRIEIETATVVVGQGEQVAQPRLRPGRYTVIAIRDSGTGIAADVLGRVFDPFFTTKEVGKGSGLGLSQVYGFMQESGGGVTLESAPASGTVVRLYLPAIEAAPAGRAEAPAATAAEPAGVGAKCVLVVEDEPAVLELAVECLTAAGFRVLSARDAGQALAVLRGDAVVDILFSDVVMPGEMDGCELAAEARRLRPGIRIVMTSGYARGERAAGGAIPGEGTFLPKPWRPEGLAAALAEPAA